MARLTDLFTVDLDTGDDLVKRLSVEATFEATEDGIRNYLNLDRITDTDDNFKPFDEESLETFAHQQLISSVLSEIDKRWVRGDYNEALEGV